MPVTVERLPNESILIATYTEPYDGNTDVVESNRLVAEMLDDIPGKIYFINDIRQVNFNFSKVVLSMAAAFRDRSALPSDRINGIAVGTGEMLKLFVNSAKQFQYGKVNIELFDSSEDAIAFAQEKLSNGGAGVE